MISDALIVIPQAGILAFPVSASLILARRVSIRRDWDAHTQRIFWIISSRTLLVLTILITALEVTAAANHPTGTQWGRATLSLYLNFFIILIPGSAFLGLISVAVYSRFSAKATAQQAGAGNPSKRPETAQDL